MATPPCRCIAQWRAPPEHARLILGGYHVMAADFHVHSHPRGAVTSGLFSKEEAPEGILDAIRHGRTVVYDRAGRTYGDPAWTRVAAADGRLPLVASGVASGATCAAGFLSLFSRIAGILGLTAAAVAGLAPGRVQAG